MESLGSTVLETIYDCHRQQALWEVAYENASTIKLCRAYPHSYLDELSLKDSK